MKNDEKRCFHFIWGVKNVIFHVIWGVKKDEKRLKNVEKWRTHQNTAGENCKPKNNQKKHTNKDIPKLFLKKCMKNSTTIDECAVF